MTQQFNNLTLATRNYQNQGQFSQIVIRTVPAFSSALAAAPPNYNAYVPCFFQQQQPEPRAPYNYRILQHIQRHNDLNYAHQQDLQRLAPQAQPQPYHPAAQQPQYEPQPSTSRQQYPPQASGQTN